MDELQLIAACKEHNRKAQKELYGRYAGVMYSICLRYASDTDTAKDLLQDGFMKVFEKVTTFEGRGSFEGWMKRLFVNLALGHIRKSKANFEVSDSIEDIPDVEDDSLDENAMNSISQEDLMQMILELPEGYSTVFNLYAIEDYSHKEIAQMLDISEGTSRSQYARARKILQDKVNDYITKGEPC